MRTKKQKKASRKWAENRRTRRAVIVRNGHSQAVGKLGLVPMQLAQAMMAAFGAGMRRASGRSS